MTKHQQADLEPWHPNKLFIIKELTEEFGSIMTAISDPRTTWTCRIVDTAIINMIASARQEELERKMKRFMKPEDKQGE